MAYVFKKLNAMAPTIGPTKVRNPPSTVMKTISPEKVQIRMSGLARPLSGAHSAPAMPVKVPEMTNAMSR